METITAPASTQPPTPASENPPVRETIEGPAGTLFDEVKRVIEEGTARRIVVKQGDQVVVEFPLVVGVVGTVLAAPLAALGALIALLGDCTIEVERDEPSTEAEPVSEEAPEPNPSDASWATTSRARWVLPMPASPVRRITRSGLVVVARARSTRSRRSRSLTSPMVGPA
jgi:pyruvate/2-oxoglutarate dehydrogenase complex dihydrolipoamide acyltransferase (E2) component